MPPSTFTPNLHLERLPPNQSVWAQRMNDNLTAIDAAVSAFVVINNLRGAWANSTVYAVGDAVIDMSTATIWQAQVAHTSSTIPATFLEERVEFPTYWATFSTPATNRGAWSGPGTAYTRNDFVLAEGTKYAFCLVSHTSSADFDTDLGLGRWSVLIDLSVVGSLVLPVLSGLSDANKFVTTNSAGNAYQISSGTQAMALLDGVLPVAKGGTGVTSSTGTGDVVLSDNGTLNAPTLNSPTLITPTITDPTVTDGLFTDAQLTNAIANTQTPGTNNTLVATTAYADLAMRALVIRVQTFTSNGTYTPHANMLYCIIDAWGGGGGGGGCAAASANNNATGSGGGAGGYSRSIASKATIGASQTVTIGAAGTAATAGANNGGAGGNTSLGTICVANGGGGGGGAVDGGSAGGAAGGTAGTGTVIAAPGAPSLPTFVANTGSVILFGGTGASTLVGAGGVGLSNSGGTNASGRGAGGAGGHAFNTGVAKAGTAGTAGLVVVIEFCWS